MRASTRAPSVPRVAVRGHDPTSGVVHLLPRVSPSKSETALACRRPGHDGPRRQYGEQRVLPKREPTATPSGRHSPAHCITRLYDPEQLGHRPDRTSSHREFRIYRSAPDPVVAEGGTSRARWSTFARKGSPAACASTASPHAPMLSLRLTVSFRDIDFGHGLWTRSGADGVGLLSMSEVACTDVRGHLHGFRPRRC
jgi:hypothetical protein